MSAYRVAAPNDEASRELEEVQAFALRLQSERMRGVRQALVAAAALALLTVAVSVLCTHFVLDHHAL